MIDLIFFQSISQIPYKHQFRQDLQDYQDNNEAFSMPHPHAVGG
jgi:hypothetical protein